MVNVFRPKPPEVFDPRPNPEEQLLALQSGSNPGSILSATEMTVLLLLMGKQPSKSLWGEAVAERGNSEKAVSHQELSEAFDVEDFVPTLEKVGKLLGVTKMRVGDIRKRVSRKIDHYCEELKSQGQDPSEELKVVFEKVLRKKPLALPVRTNSLKDYLETLPESAAKALKKIADSMAR